MMNPNLAKQIDAGFVAAACYNRAGRTTICGDRQIGQLWLRWGDIIMGAAKFYAAEIAREEAMIAEYENRIALENMPCMEEA